MSPRPVLTGEVVRTTERMVLRRFTTADVDPLVELDSDPAVMHFITGGLATPRSEIVDEVLPCWLGHYETYPGYGFFAAQDRATGDFLGWFHLRPGDGVGPDEPELGYRLRRSAWGRGLATEGSRALVDAALSSTTPAVSTPRRWRSTPPPVGRWRRRAWCWCGPSGSPGPTRSRATSMVTSSTTCGARTGLLVGAERPTGRTAHGSY